MKLPLSWMREFVSVDAPVEEIARRLSFAGLVVENVERLRPGFTGVFVARVTGVEKHPNADRLNLCDVDAGEKGKFKVVCGAPNVKAGMIAPLALVGARMVGADKGQHGDSTPRFEQAPPLEAAVIRGVRSEGMLCSERELGLSQDHAGILALGADAPIGGDVAAYLQLDDTVLDVEITPNRGDCLSILGLAREVSALFAARLRAPHMRAAHKPGSADGVEFTVSIEAPDLCPRYAGLALSGIKIGPSPAWLKKRLELCGMRALNNVVDATNYVMLELGQPLHAFDFAKIAGGKIVVRRAAETREFVTLDNATRALDPDDLLIADSDKPLAIAGVMGGLNSEVSDATTTILLESAYFKPMTVARTSRRLGLRSEASYRFERGIDRAGQVGALIRAAELIRKIAHGREASSIGDFEPRKAEPCEIALDLDAMESLLGAAIPSGIAKSRLKSLGAQVSTRSKGVLAVVPPSFRSDLIEQADLIEEVARLGGLEEIPALLPPRISALAPVNREREFIKGTREVLLGCGLSEAATIAFIAPADNARFPGIQTATRPVKVSNPLSAELSELRVSLVPGLVTSLRFNLNREARAFHAFEVGKTFRVEGDLAAEQNHLAAISYGPYAISAIGEPGIAAGFFTLKGMLETYFDAIGVAGRIAFEAIEPGDAPFLHPGRSASVMLDGAPIGMIGELHPAEAMRLDLSDPCALCELDLSSLISYGFSPRKTFEPPPKFPAIRRDLALVLDRNFPADMVVKTIRECGASLLESVEVFDVYEGTAVASGKKSVALACRYRAKDRTLTDEEVNRIHAVLVEQARMRLGAELRQ